jgi:hypothetical protein
MSVAKDNKQARRYLGLARKQLEDRKIYNQQIDETEALTKKTNFRSCDASVLRSLAGLIVMVGWKSEE